MKIHLYSICWNEEKFLPFFFKHYNEICDKITIYDNESTDNSRNIIKGNPNTELKTFKTSGKINEKVFVKMKNDIWKRDKDADWAIVVDVDELITGINLRQRLEALKNSGFTLIKTCGYDMVSRHFDYSKINKQAYEQIDKGAYSPDLYSKQSVFSPRDIKQTNFAVGMHNADMKGSVVKYHGEDIKLLHFKNIDFKQTVDRYKILEKRRSELNKKNNWGFQYAWGEEEIDKYYKELEEKTVKITV